MTTKDMPGGVVHPATMEVHPAADLFPMIEGPEFEELVEDIRKNGLRTPILLDTEGRLLDGRNRLRACRAAGVEPQFTTWQSHGSPLEMVVSLNLRRRHLSESQRAMLGARLREKFAEEARNRMISGKAGNPRANWHEGRSDQKAAAILNVSARSVARAARILKSGDQQWIRDVESGQAPVSAASRQAAGSGRHRSRKTLSTEEVLRMLWEPARHLAQAIWEIERRGGAPAANRKGTRTVRPSRRKL